MTTEKIYGATLPAASPMAYNISAVPFQRYRKQHWYSQHKITAVMEHRKSDSTGT